MDKTSVNFKEYLLKPGYVVLPAEPTRIFCTLGSGGVVTLFDKRLKIGGMTAYLEPVRHDKAWSTPFFACPAIVGLIRLCLNGGSRRQDLEAQVYGGSDNVQARAYKPGLGQRNFEAALEILHKEGIEVVGQDFGGYRGRKIVFNTRSGEVLVARLNQMVPQDWYPHVHAG